MSLLNKHSKFPRYPKPASSLSNLPHYESQMNEPAEKQSYYDEPQDSSFELPPFEMPSEKQASSPPARFPPTTGTSEKSSFSPPQDLSRLELPARRPANYDLRMPPLQEQSLENKKERMPDTMNMLQDTEPIYVRLEEYKKAVKNISFIRDKLDEAEQILSEIMQMKKEEDQQMMDWYKEITEIKNKLIEVDRGLFEVHK